jgi:flagellin-like hook-associated protein FlgL
MIGGLTSSLALAQRTAGKARATMDTMARQIATGQKVASVKDDGAAWARVTALRGQKVENNTLITHVGLATSWAEPRRAGVEASRSLWADIRGTLLDMATPGLSASTFAAHKARAEALFIQDAQSVWPQYFSDTIENGAPNFSVAADRLALRVVDASGQDLLGGTMVSVFNSGTSPGSRTYSGMLIDHASGVTAGTRTNPGGTITTLAAGGVLIPRLDDLADVLQTLGFVNAAMDASGVEVAAIGQTANALDRLQTRLEDKNDLLTSAIGALSDADMGKASAARAQAETRQQLALSTVRQAISAYGNFAGGLLGNVQRTQQGVLA